MNGYGAPTTYGVPTATWNTWSASKQQLYLVEYNRTKEQQDYYYNQTIWYDLAYAYTGVVDEIFGTEAVEVGEDVNIIIENLKEDVEDVLDTGKDIGIGIAIAAVVGLVLVLRK